MKRLIKFLFLLLLVTSCKKDATVIIQAQNINNPSDGSHYAGMKYQIFERKNVFYDNRKSKLMAEGFLDGNGRATAIFNMHSSRDYVLGIIQPDNVCYSEITIEHFLDYGKSNDVHFNYAPCGFFNLNKLNANCEGPTDEMRFRYYYLKNEDVYSYYGSWYTESGYLGCQNAQLPIYDEKPAGDYIMEWQVTRPSGTTTGIDTFTVPENDSVTYLIEY